MPTMEVTDKIAQLLTKVANRQKNCAPVTVQIGKTNSNHQVQHDILIITDAPECVIQMLSKEEDYIMYLEDGGLHVCPIRR